MGGHSLSRGFGKMRPLPWIILLIGITLVQGERSSLDEKETVSKLPETEAGKAEEIEKISEKKKMVETLPCIEVGYVPGVAEIVEAGVVVEKETEHTRLGSDKSHFSALSIILLTIP